ncbi:hypothetical protein F1188_20010 [Roseospira marina]|uniref:Type I-U CRISPR-associated helicase/endonuclease Cas3 n=1 Tax=Roseospira marina TaxID=140057 RepID=A0A5M6I4X3_9PROT|nr:hypothetical protein [Roseospira marina]KAA5603232.1 hypothetical protein F1188_20010 [Roseospira marina]MBB4316193.1 hypothetical protein [Roseospira marina]MBB5089391.1 hypothetical protein [Roseospira marina]
MTEALPLTADDFPKVFHAIHGHPPFPWQARLAAQVARERIWPDALDLPTGSGKTAALDIALFHLALEADRGADRTAPVRVAFVVDRRIIVDAAFERAKKIADALATADPTGPKPLDRMAGALRGLSGDGPPLVVQALRGGLPREADWARTPAQPTILCSTVDQVGSRLLFRGYGVSDSMKPIHAGLLGADCLLLLDEAHLAAPFAQTLAWVGQYRGRPWTEVRAAPWRVVTLAEPTFKIDIARAAAEGCAKLAPDYDFGGRQLLNYTRAEMRAINREGLSCGGPSAVRRLAVYSVLAHESDLKDPKTPSPDSILARPVFNCLDVAQVKFLKNLREATATSPDHAEEIGNALFASWRRRDRFTTFRWDAAEDRRHAYRFKAPTSDPVRTQAGANRLAAVGLAALPGAAVERRGRIHFLNLGTELAPGQGGRFVTWPIWGRPASLATIQALLGHPTLGAAEPRHDVLRRLGVVGVHRARRIAVGKYFNFTRAEAL